MGISFSCSENPDGFLCRVAFSSQSNLKRGPIKLDSNLNPYQKIVRNKRGRSGRNTRCGKKDDHKKSDLRAAKQIQERECPSWFPTSGKTSILLSRNFKTRGCDAAHKRYKKAMCTLTKCFDRGFVFSWRSVARRREGFRESVRIEWRHSNECMACNIIKRDTWVVLWH
jgi:hypothetical protein